MPGFACASARPAFAVDDFAFFHENVLGTSLELRVMADDQQSAQRAEGGFLARSIAWPRSSAGMIMPANSAGGRPRPEADEAFSRALRGALGMRRLARTAAPEPLIPGSRCSPGSGRGPPPGAVCLKHAELAAARALLAQPAWRSRPGTHTVERLTDCPLSLNAIAKGYIVERACAAALVPGRGLHGVLLNVGGDLRVCGEAPRMLGIAAPWADSESTRADRI